VVITLFVIFLLTLTASLVQSDFGNVDVQRVVLVSHDGNTLVGKIYRPITATSSSPAPAALLLHGLNNDKDTEAPTAIELSRRGIVAMTLDELNHGDSAAAGDVLGTSDDPSLGAISAFDYLAQLDFVQAINIGLVGHSMGGYSANATAASRPSHKAIVFQAFGPLNLTTHSYFNNYLQIWDKYEESAMMTRASWVAEGETMITYNVQQAGETLASPVYDTTYGSFADGSAQRYALIDSTHPGGTWKAATMTEVVAWLEQALMGKSAASAYDDASSHVYYIKEGLMLLALVLSLLALVPLVNRLLDLDYFSEITQETPTLIFYEGRSWWKAASLNALLGGVTFVFLPFIGVLLFSAINAFLPIFPLLIGNGFMFWFVINAIICHFFYRRWRHTHTDISAASIGAVSRDNPDFDRIIGRSLVLVFVAFVFLYAMTAILQWLFPVELRYMWSFIRVLQPARFLAFLIYLIPIGYFFLMNGGVFLFGQARAQAGAESIPELLRWWLLNSYNMLSVIALVFLLEYLPMILLGTAPLLGGILGVFWLLGIFLMQIIPEFLVLFLLMTIFFRRTGRIYVGSFIATIIVSWVLSNGAFL